MAKLTKKKFSKLDEQAAKYRWEFLRRNERYGKELRALINEIKKFKTPHYNAKKFSTVATWETPNLGRRVVV